jgi:hypothetical protein
MVMARVRDSTSAGSFYTADRLRGNTSLGTATTAIENNDADSFMTPTVGFGNSFSAMNGFGVGNDATRRLNYLTNLQVAHAFRRAPGFMDVVCYTGTGSLSRVLPHNLGATPELIILKDRNTASAYNWAVQASGPLGFSSNLALNTNDANATNGIDYLFSAGSATSLTTASAFPTYVNTSSTNYVAYLFASCPGVSKVGSYTGTGALQTIDCGFTLGARYVLIKRTDSTGGWYVWDSARGIISGDDPYLLLNTTVAEITNTNYVDTDTTGFKVTAAAPADINASGGTYIFLAIA